MPNSQLKLRLRKHGLKANGPLTEASLYVDCRTMAEHGLAHSDEGFVLANKTWLNLQLDLVCRAINLIPDRRKNKLPDPYSKPFSICFICAYGQTRSRLTRDWMAKALKEEYPHADIALS